MQSPTKFGATNELKRISKDGGGGGTIHGLEREFRRRRLPQWRRCCRLDCGGNVMFIEVTPFVDPPLRSRTMIQPVQYVCLPKTRGGWKMSRNKGGGESELEPKLSASLIKPEPKSSASLMRDLKRGRKTNKLQDPQLIVRRGQNPSRNWVLRNHTPRLGHVTQPSICNVFVDSCSGDKLL